MNSGVRVLKRGRNNRSKTLPVDRSEKTDRQSDREIVSKIKSWIAELDLRRLSRRTEALRPAEVTIEHSLLAEMDLLSSRKQR